MQNNSNWFESSPNHLNFTHLHLRQEIEHEESLPNRNPIPLTPFSHHPLSPFMPFSQNHCTQNQHLHPIEQEPQAEGIHQILSFSQQESRYGQEPMTPHRTGRPKRQIPTTSRKSHSEIGEYTKKTRPKQSGLRGLSMRAYQVVLKMKQTTYKQVAERLVVELNLKQNDNINGHEETNVKRRVYDALNVLIAARVICRDGRIISSLKGENIVQSVKDKNQEIKSLRKKIAIKQHILEQKQRKLQQARQKILKTEQLLQKNLNNYAQVHKDKTMITFPFIGLLYQEGDLKQVQMTKDKISLTLSEIIHPFGDIDCLKWL